MSDAQVAAQSHAPTPKFCYDFPQGSPCANIILYTQDTDSKGTRLTIMTTIRAPHVGAGRALSAGGFYEVKDMFNEVGKVQNGLKELYRECYEELGEEFKTIIPYEDFERRAQYLWSGMHRIRDTQLVHNILSMTMQISHEEMDAIVALPDTEEQIGKVLETFTLEYDGSTTSEEAVMERFADFYHPMEKTVSAMFLAKQHAAFKGMVDDYVPYA